MTKSTAAMQRMTTGVRFSMKATKVSSLTALPIMMFGGSPISVAVPPMFEAYLFPTFFKEFREKFPTTILDVQEFGDSDEVRERVEVGDLDFGVIFGSPETTFPHEFVIMHDAMSLCLPEGHPLSAKKEVAFESLRRERFILQQPRTYQYRAIFARCIEAGFTPDVMLTTSQLKTIKQLVANGTGISILPDFVLREETSFVRRPLGAAPHVAHGALLECAQGLFPARPGFPDIHEAVCSGGQVPGSGRRRAGVTIAVKTP